MTEDLADLADRFGSRLEAAQVRDADGIVGLAVDVFGPAIEQIQAAVERVRELAKAARPGGSIPPADCTNTCFHDACNCSGNWRPTSWKLNPADVLAALDVPQTSGGEP